MIKVVVPVSGGKDSQACLKLALQQYPAHEVLGLFCDTQFEHPKTYAHIETMRELYGVNIIRVCSGSVAQQCLKHKRFPGNGSTVIWRRFRVVLRFGTVYAAMNRQRERERNDIRVKSLT